MSCQGLQVVILIAVLAAALSADDHLLPLHDDGAAGNVTTDTMVAGAGAGAQGTLCIQQLARDGCVPLAGQAVCDACLEKHSADLLAAGCNTSFVVGYCQGSAQRSVRQFLGLRYAEPPTGGRRFLPAILAPLNESQMSRNNSYGPDCIQNGRKAFKGEDCLFLNVWTPAQLDGHQLAPLLPVMVWIHGGGFHLGSGRDYHGSVLAASQNVVVVTLNYRLGALGFFTSEELLRSNTSRPRSNGGLNGLNDMVVALQWLHNNLHRFGGARDRITVFGQSAGAISICTLLVSPRAQGLFQRAIIESGPCTGPWTIGTEDEALALSLIFSKGRSLEALRKLDAMTAFTQGSMVLPGVDHWILPAAEGQPLQRYHQAIAAGRTLNAQSVMLGGNSFDGLETWIIPAGELGLARYESDMLTSFPSNSSAVERLYPLSRFGGSRNGALTQSTGDCDVVCPNYELAELVTQTEATAFVYYFDYGPVCNDRALQRNVSTAPITHGWASHAAELFWAFGWPRKCFTNSSELALTRAMQDYWGSFAREGEPSLTIAGDNSQNWTAFSRSLRNTMVLDLNWRMEHGWKSHDCASLRAAAGRGNETWPCLLA